LPSKYSRSPDPRFIGFSGGRSINLALAERGLQALRTAGLADDVLQHAVMMRGRMVHGRENGTGLQRYGVDDSEVIWSVSRGALNTLLLDAAEAAGADSLRPVAGTTSTSTASAWLVRCGRRHTQRALRHADRCRWCRLGVRAAMNAYAPLGERIESLGHGYKELEIPPPRTGLNRAGNGAYGPFAIEPHALHIWPRGGYMCIALPNTEGSFTVTLVPAEPMAAHRALPACRIQAAAAAFFREDFPACCR
jgi:kynurenine 3-monooxygenase